MTPLKTLVRDDPRNGKGGDLDVDHDAPYWITPTLRNMTAMHSKQCEIIVRLNEIAEKLEAGK